MPIRDWPHGPIFDIRYTFLHYYDTDTSLHFFDTLSFLSPFAAAAASAVMSFRAAIFRRRFHYFVSFSLLS
jgi:hypothetical protein